MQSESFLAQVPLWLLYVVTALVVMLSIAGGSLLGSRARRRRKAESDAPLGAVVGSVLGLLAFILAFTFGMAGSRFDTRKQLLLDEVNAIGTALLRTDFLPEAQRAETRKLLRRYVDIRTEAVLHPESLPQALADSEAVHDQLWAQVLTLTEGPGNPVLLGLYVQSLNEVIDFHCKRVTVGLQHRIPGAIWIGLYFVTVLAMAAVGYYFGVAGSGRSLVSFVLALSFSAIILLIADLDRPSGGLLSVSQVPMLELQQKMSHSDK